MNNYKGLQLLTFKWLYGSHLLLNDVHYIIPNDISLNEFKIDDYKVYCDGVSVSTGMFDKNKNMIYENDYLNDLEGYVKYCTTSGSFWIGALILSISCEHRTIVGNRFNPKPLGEFESKILDDCLLKNSKKIPTLKRRK